MIKAAFIAKIFYQEDVAFESWKKFWFVIKYVILKQTLILNMFIEWMSEDSIFIVRSRWKRLPKTHLYCLFFMSVSFGDKKKRRKLQLRPLWERKKYYLLFENWMVFYLWKLSPLNSHIDMLCSKFDWN